MERPVERQRAEGQKAYQAVARIDRRSATEEQRKALSAAVRQMREANKPLGALQERLAEQIEPLLTEQQKQSSKLPKVINFGILRWGHPVPFRELNKLGLTADQKTQIARIKTDFEKAFRANRTANMAALKKWRHWKGPQPGGKEIREMTKKLHADIHAVLGDALTETLKKNRRWPEPPMDMIERFVYRTKLTDAQETQIAALRATYKTKFAALAGDDAKRGSAKKKQLLTDHLKQIESLLTDDQKSQFRQMLAPLRHALPAAAD